MPRISESKIKKIEEQILYFLYNSFPHLRFTVEIAIEIARDEEFVKRLLLSLEKKGLVTKIDRNPEGIKYERRLRWRISSKAHKVYDNAQ